jgi:predicted nucleic acid-binding protein
MIILDTNVLSGLIRPEPDRAIVSWLDGQARLSVWTTSITIYEVRYGLAIMPAGRRRTLTSNEFQRVLDEDFEGRVLPFDTEAAAQAASLMGRRHEAGRMGELRDTMIAGIALAQRATLVTRNVRHFDDLEIPVVNPWTL